MMLGAYGSRTMVSPLRSMTSGCWAVAGSAAIEKMEETAARNGARRPKSLEEGEEQVGVVISDQMLPRRGCRKHLPRRRMHENLKFFPLRRFNLGVRHGLTAVHAKIPNIVQDDDWLPLN